MNFCVLFLLFGLSLATFPDWAIQKYSSKKEFELHRSQPIESLQEELDYHLHHLYNTPSLRDAKERREIFNRVFLLTNALLEKAHNIPEPIIDLHFLDNNTVRELTIQILKEASSLYHSDESKVENGVIYLMTGQGNHSSTGVGFNRTIVKNAILRSGVQVSFPNNIGILAAVFGRYSRDSPLPRANFGIGEHAYSPKSTQATSPFFQNTSSNHLKEDYNDPDQITFKEDSVVDPNYLADDEWRAFEAEFNEQPSKEENEWFTVTNPKGKRSKVIKGQR